ncbi:ABC transporter ATP-binding protein [Thermosphaera aggregans]|jgi:simple sugar transport system ATP-binding protein|uniref:Nucleoside ABC transporter ATP-binding protein n=1 Tax=Thermosphaera aggregans (strain DSM 11486 / M11TL) TaxID=633148 RepID=D5U2Q0_THEAM|nr:ABC transporter ATP-binding protein [Thermosphaera aggregans]ADG91400.1 nucleoside ABC transporter ATP-binding protein [Thermosphaera aggregans DSM 11486]
MSSGEFIVEMLDIWKTYPDGVRALEGVSLRLRRGEIHGLLGENGAGKTTLMRILSGLIKPSHGTIIVNGRRVFFKNSSEALSLGIGMVHQHPALVPVFTARENIYLGLKPSQIDDARLEEVIKSSGLSIPLDVKVEDLSLGLRQKVEIIKMLYRGVNVLILDEPTTNMTPLETEELFKSLVRLKNEGKTIVFISHKLREVLQVTDRVTVLRKGKVAGEVETGKTTPGELARLMVGREVFLKVEKKPREVGRPLLEVEDLWVKGDLGQDAVRGVTFKIHEGEILGIAGVEGNGQVELVEAVTGLRKPWRGRIVFNGVEVKEADPLLLYNMGLAHIPEDRQKMGLILEMSLWENSILGLHATGVFTGKFGLFKYEKIFSHADKIVKEFEILAPNIFTPVRSLSGGNQQKLVAGRELSKKPLLIVANQPTRGLDVAATEYIRKLLVQLRDEGKGVLLVSSDLDEILELSDRVAVMYKGEFMGIVKPGEVSIKELGLMIGGYKLSEVRAGEG